MTTQDYKDRFVSLIEGRDVVPGDTVKYVENAIKLGLADFWGAHSWTFKHYQYSLVIPSSVTEESFDLPDNFESLRAVREEEGSIGHKLVYFTLEDFTEKVPKLSWHGQGRPQAYTLFMDADKGRWQIKFYPKPAGGETIYISMLMTAPSDCDVVPDKFASCLDAFIAKHVYPYGHPGRQGAAVQAEREYLKAQNKDRLNQSTMTQMPDGTNRQLNTRRPWV